MRLTRKQRQRAIKVLHDPSKGWADKVKLVAHIERYWVTCAACGGKGFTPYSPSQWCDRCQGIGAVAPTPGAQL